MLDRQTIGRKIEHGLDRLELYIKSKTEDVKRNINLTFFGETKKRHLNKVELAQLWLIRLKLNDKRNFTALAQRQHLSLPKRPLPLFSPPIVLLSALFKIVLLIRCGLSKRSDSI